MFPYSSFLTRGVVAWEDLRMISVQASKQTNHENWLTWMSSTMGRINSSAVPQKNWVVCWLLKLQFSTLALCLSHTIDQKSVKHWKKINCPENFPQIGNFGVVLKSDHSYQMILLTQGTYLALFHNFWPFSHCQNKNNPLTTNAMLINIQQSTLSFSPNWLQNASKTKK